MCCSALECSGALGLETTFLRVSKVTRIFLLQIIAKVSVHNRTRTLVKGLQRVTDVKLLTNRVEELSFHLLEFPEMRGVAVQVCLFVSPSLPPLPLFPSSSPPPLRPSAPPRISDGRRSGECAA